MRLCSWVEAYTRLHPDPFSLFTVSIRVYPSAVPPYVFLPDAPSPSLSLGVHSSSSSQGAAALRFLPAGRIFFFPVTLSTGGARRCKAARGERAPQEQADRSDEQGAGQRTDHQVWTGLSAARASRGTVARCVLVLLLRQAAFHASGGLVGAGPKVDLQEAAVAEVREDG